MTQRGFLRRAGEWNYQQVTVDGSRIQVELNGTTIVDADTSEITESMDGDVYKNLGTERGHFGLAGHSDPVAFRNLSIKKLPDSPSLSPAGTSPAKAQ